MKKYKLLKDIPGLRAGGEFEQIVDGLYCNLTLRNPGQPHYDFEIKYVENNPEWFEEIR